MRLLLDLQGAQSGSRFRGIGRFSVALSQAIARNAGAHEVWIGLSDSLPEAIPSLVKAFDGLVPEERILIWDTTTPTAHIVEDNEWRRGQAAVIREAAIDNLDPDVVFVSSMVEGFGDNAMCTIGEHFPGRPTAVTLYDLIPLMDPIHYLNDPGYERFYRGRVAQLRRADVLFAISESAKGEAEALLGVPEDRVINIRAAADDCFQPQQLDPDLEADLRERTGLTKPFLMYSGGVDARKNVGGLIRAFAALPKKIRSEHQLAVVGIGDDEMLPKLAELTETLGLDEDEVVFTGYVTNDDLVGLYNICVGFVFPSLHEGFGLPPLEAMSCGAPTVAANNTSIPEVVGNPAALFDARDVTAMTAAMNRLLTDPTFREDLRQQGLLHAATFSWDDSARRALVGFERLAESKTTGRQALDGGSPQRPTLALVSGLPDRGTVGRAQLVTLVDELDRTYSVTLVTDTLVGEFEGAADVVDWRDFTAQSGRFDRIVHHYANDPSYGFMPDLQALHPGTVILDDLYLDGAVSASPGFDSSRSAWAHGVVASHGWGELIHRLRESGAGRYHPRLPLNREVLALANGVIVTDDTIAASILADPNGPKSNEVVFLPPPLPVHVPPFVAEGPDTDLVVAFGPGGTVALHHRLVEAWAASALISDPSVELALVGQDPDDAFGRRLAARALELGFRIRFLPSEDSEAALAHARVAVQLSMGQSGSTSMWRRVCADAGLTVLGNDGVRLPTRFTDSELAAGLEAAWREANSVERVDVIGDARQGVGRFAEAIEAFHATGPYAHEMRALQIAARYRSDQMMVNEWDRTAAAVRRNRSPRASDRQLLLDVSGIVVTDSRTGIQRVVRSLARELLLSPPEGFRVELVYAISNGDLRYARRYAGGLIGLDGVTLKDGPVLAQPGDVFVGLDLNPGLAFEFLGRMEWLRARGVSMHYVVYDMIPIQFKQWFPFSWFDDWFSYVVSNSDGLLCISQAVADQVTSWIPENAPQEIGRIPVDWFHLGADIESSAPTSERGYDLERTLRKRAPGLSILMVGTLEPRKGHRQALDAFDLLWRNGSDANLVIVGRPGWLMEDLADELRKHPQRGKRLFWFENASDAELQHLYRWADGCLQASLAEGFGLPLIEAARHGIPLLVRDLPVFQELAGSSAAYFHGQTAEALASALAAWFEEIAAGSAPDSAQMSWLTWSESAERFLSALLRQVPQSTSLAQ